MSALLAVGIVGVLCVTLAVVLTAGRPVVPERVVVKCSPGCRYPGAAAAVREDGR